MGSERPEKPTVGGGRQGGWWLVAVVAAVVVPLAASTCGPGRLAGSGGKIVREAVRRGVTMWAAMTEAELSEQAASFVSGIPQVSEDMSLVVARLDFTKHLYAENNKRRFGIDFGTTRVLLSAPVRIHYSVALAGDPPVRFRVDAERDMLIAVFPAPEVQAVEVFSDQKKSMMEVGWARLKSVSGQALLDNLDRDLYGEVRRTAEDENAMRVARRQSRESLTAFVGSFLAKQSAWGTEGGFRTVTVCFDDEELSDVLPASGVGMAE